MFLFSRHVSRPLAALGAALALASCGGSSGAGGTGPVASRLPINTAGWSDSPFISRDGKRLYFMYSRYDFGPWILSGGATPPRLAGPDRAGLHKSSTNPFDESDIYVSTLNADGSWSEPVAMGFNGNWGDSSGMEINNGNGFVWLRGDGAVNDIVTATRNQDGSWTTPLVLGGGINAHGTGILQDNPHLSPDGNALWFTSTRANGQGGKDFWFSMQTNGAWSTPLNVIPPFSSTGDDDQLWISPVSADVYWNGPNGLMHCTSNGSTCTAAPAVVTIPGCGFAAEASMPDDGSRLYFACGNLTTGRVSIMYSVKQPNGSWGPATPVD
jgi:hypothetical protein